MERKDSILAMKKVTGSVLIDMKGVEMNTTIKTQSLLEFARVCFHYFGRGFIGMQNNVIKWRRCQHSFTTGTRRKIKAILDDYNYYEEFIYADWDRSLVYLSNGRHAIEYEGYSNNTELVEFDVVIPWEYKIVDTNEFASQHIRS